MSESQSRYSIVSDLTKMKLSLIDAKASIDNQLLVAEQEYTTAKDNVKSDKEEIDHIAKNKKDQVDLQVSEKKVYFENVKKGKEGQIKAIELKIAAIDSALKNVEDISKSAAGTITAE